MHWSRNLFFGLNRFAIPHQLIRGTLDRSVHRSLVPSAAHSIARSLARSFGRSVSRTLHLPLSLSRLHTSFSPTLSPAYLTLRPPSLDLLIGTKHFILMHTVLRARTTLFTLTHSLTHSVTHSLTLSLTHSLTLSLSHSLTHSLTHSLSHSLSNSLHIHVWIFLWSNTDTVSNPSTHAIENTKLQEAIDDSMSNAHAL